MSKEFILSILLLLLFQSGYSQIKLKAAVSAGYTYGFASGDLHTYISGKAFDGADIQYRQFVQKNFSLGIRTGWNSFKTELPRNVYDTDKGTVSAVQTRNFYSLPLLVTGYYYLRSSHYVMPYVGGGVGGYLLSYEKWFGIVQTKDNSLHVGFSPEVGVVFPFKNSGIGLILNGKFNNVFYSHNEFKRLRFFETAIGVYIGYAGFDKKVLFK